MKGIRTTTRTSSNQILISIPDEMKNTDLEIIILPAYQQPDSEIEFWSENELEELSKMDLSKAIDDKEDYSKW